MDTKLKNNKKISLLIMLLLIAAATICFCVQYPVFKRNVQRYQVDILQSDEFLTDIYKGNMVLYRELMERVTGERVKYRDLFLQVLAEPDYLGEGEAYVNLGGKAWGEVAGNVMDSLLESWEESVRGDLGVAREMDYRMTDHASGLSISNTGYDISKLGTKEADEELMNRYPYYIKMSFSDTGYLENVSVKGKNSDALLKAVQSGMRSKFLTTKFWERSFYDYEDEPVYYYTDNDQLMKAETEIFNAPRGCTICYALTGRQMETLIAHNSWQNWYYYYNYSGAAGAYSGILIFLAIPALLLPLWKRRTYTLHQSGMAKIPFEIAVVVMIFELGVGANWITDLVIGIVEGSLAEMIGGLLGGLPLASYQINCIACVIAWIINFVVVYLVFGLWYYMVTSLGQIWELGIRGYLRERSLICRYTKRIWGFCIRKVKIFENELLHVDLGKKANKTVLRVVAVNFIILGIICAMWVFGWMALIIYSIILYMVLKKYVQKIQEQYRKLLEATESIAGGNLQTEFDKDWGVFESYKDELVKIQSGFSRAVEEEVKSQKMKTELITNVSHDLKTPLTAITTYIELLKEEGLAREQQKEYIEVLEKKALRLKNLIEDLFEVSKASSGSVALNFQEVDIGNLIRQVYLEYEDKVEEADLIFRFYLPDKKIILNLDSQKTYRVFENLYTNIIKYAMPHTRVYVNLEQTEDEIVIELKNMSQVELNIPAESLTERFVRGDSSRNTEGSGLGLAIARSFVELQKGQMKVDIDGDLFKVTIRWKVV